MSIAFKSDTELAIHPSFAPETIYRRFFIAAILVILTVGAAWGTILLWQVGRAGSFTGVSIHAVNAHGHAQIFGWVGLFIMGFAYQAFPRMWGTKLFAPHMAVATFVLMIVSLALGTAGIASAEWSLAVPAVIVGGVLQSLAASIFAGQILVTFRRSNERLSPAAGFIFMALFFFIAMSVMSAWHSVALMQAETREALLAQIATYQAALRDLQVHGLALFMILGVSMRFFPGMFGLPRTSPRRGWLAFALLSFAVLAEVALLIASGLTGNTALAGLLIAPWLLLAIGIALIVLPWRLWRPLPTPSRSNKFIRTAYLWLAVSLVLLLLLPVYMMLREMTFSHAYYGAVRHAVTVGFVSLMIMGVAARVVPSLNGVDSRTLSPLWGPFLLVNLGCLLRVSTQILTDWHGGFYAVIALSGGLEVTGLAWWGVGLIFIMVRKGRPAALECRPSAAGQRFLNVEPRAHPIKAEHRVIDVVSWFPEVRPLFSRFGCKALMRPMVLRMVGGSLTIERLARYRGVAPDTLIAALNDHIGGQDQAVPTLGALPREALDIDMTIGEIAEAHPKYQPMLTQLGLDTCCSAERTVREIAMERGVEATSLVNAIEQETPGLMSPILRNNCACGHRH